MAGTTMTTGRVGRHLRQLFEAGSAVGLSDGELLERFAASRRDDQRRESAESAFEAIVARHGPTVLSVCRQVLGDNHAAEDAFQATFLVLVRRAPALRIHPGGSLGSWLHGVACRTAMKARVGAARRRAREHGVAQPEARGDGAAERIDLGAVLHAEVVRLPARYREAIVLCYFEGRSHDEAAATLGCPVGTVRSRLSRARAMLRDRLIRRGLAPAVAAAAIESAARAEVPAPLFRAVLEIAVHGAPAAAVAGLADRVVAGLLAGHLRLAVAAGIGLVAMAVGLGLASYGASRSPGRPLRNPVLVRVASETQPTPKTDRPDEPLPDHARARLGTPAFRHGGAVDQVLFTRDGRTLVTVDEHRVMTIWDAATGRLRHQVALAGYRFDRVALSPDGATLATTEPIDGPLRLWDVATGRERRRWHLPVDYGCSRPTFAPDGRTLITLGIRGDLASPRQQFHADLWDLAAPGERRRRVPLEGRVDSDLVSPDARTLATVLPMVEKNGCLVVSEDMVLDFSRIRGGAIRLLDLATGRVRQVLRIESDYPRTVAYSPDSRYLAVALTGPMIRVFDTTDGRERHPRFDFRPPVGPPPPDQGPELSSRMEMFASLVFSPDGSILAAGSRQSAGDPSPGSIYLWDFATGRLLRRIDRPRHGPCGLAFAPVGRTIVSVDASEAIVRRWDVASGREITPQAGHVMGIAALALSPVDGTVFTGGFDGTIRRWDPATGRAIDLVGQLDSISTMAVAPDGRSLIVGGGARGELVLWSITERREIRRFARDPRMVPAVQVTFSPDGRMAACERRVWDVASGRLLALLRGRGEPEERASYPSGFLFTPDGRLAITVGPDVVRTWDVTSWKELGSPFRQEGLGVFVGVNFALSRDGRLLAAAHNPRANGIVKPEGQVRVWELPSGREVARFPGPGNSFARFAFSPDDRLLAMYRSRIDGQRQPGQSYDPDTSIRLLEIASGREVRRLEGHQGRVNDVAFTPDGRTLISASQDATALVWDVSGLAGR